MQKIISNQELIEQLMHKAGVANPNQYAKYLSKKYDRTIERQNIKQFQNSQRLTITHLLLREALEEHQPEDS